ncbi:hypothetical protein LRR18_05945 [Mangrovimonas sp. AS39]|uniref:hypothetical protein n=1 Tax=Mangrovimonas futianensis TaxID=2895523 RepID=UPI001E47D98D|nr:hypothetical protein [Mangrovimonas futianensis]MCF1191121.1 hypothetical protein [Mangrovimonas futianensis]MCF1194816.1 hypothetical protein [Mangrovimonas futianensis]
MNKIIFLFLLLSFFSLNAQTDISGYSLLSLEAKDVSFGLFSSSPSKKQIILDGFVLSSKANFETVAYNDVLFLRERPKFRFDERAMSISQEDEVKMKPIRFPKTHLRIKVYDKCN